MSKCYFKILLLYKLFWRSYPTHLPQADRQQVHCEGGRGRGRKYNMQSQSLTWTSLAGFSRLAKTTKVSRLVQIFQWYLICIQTSHCTPYGCHFLVNAAAYLYFQKFISIGMRVCVIMTYANLSHSDKC